MHTRRASWLTLAAVLGAAAVALACLLVLVGDEAGDNPAGDRPARAVAAGFAAALQARSTSQARSLTCPAARDEVMRDVAELIDGVRAARLGAVRTSGGQGSATLSITVHQRYVVPDATGGVHSREASPEITGHLDLTRQRGGWCVSRLDAAQPVY